MLIMTILLLKTNYYLLHCDWNIAIVKFCIWTLCVTWCDVWGVWCHHFYYELNSQKANKQLLYNCNSTIFSQLLLFSRWSCDPCHHRIQWHHHCSSCDNPLHWLCHASHSYHHRNIQYSIVVQSRCILTNGEKRFTFSWNKLLYSAGHWIISLIRFSAYA